MAQRAAAARDDTPIFVLLDGVIGGLPRYSGPVGNPGDSQQTYTRTRASWTSPVVWKRVPSERLVPSEAACGVCHQNHHSHEHGETYAWCETQHRQHPSINRCVPRSLDVGSQPALGEEVEHCEQQSQ